MGLAREVKRIKSEIPRVDVSNDTWANNVPVDLFFYKETEEIEREKIEQIEIEKNNNWDESTISKTNDNDWVKSNSSREFEKVDSSESLDESQKFQENNFLS